MKSLIAPSPERYNLSPMRYPWALEDWRAGRQNFWSEQEPNMGRDKASFECMNADERETFLDVFATLTTSDLVVQENLLGNIASVIEVPEIRLFMALQGADEALHSVAYQHIIEVLALGDDDIYRRYLKKKEIGQKFELANRYGRWIRGTDIVKRYLGMVFYYGGFEGIWFYYGFSPILNLGRAGKVPGTCEQLQYIARDETTHFRFGIKLLNAMADEIGRERIRESDVQRVFFELAEAERIYARACIRPVLGYNAETHTAQIEWVCNLRLAQLGWAPCFPGARNVAPWLDEVLQVKKEKNFFETRVTDYRTGAALVWE